jgi:hypothetical protein
MNKLNHILLTGALFLFAACEYDPSGNNFIDLTPPENGITIEILLNDLNPSDTICVYQTTSMSMKIKATKDLLQAAVFLDGHEYATMRNGSLSFDINPDQISEGLHKLTINPVFAAGTGSLADMMGLEAYNGELSWNIYVLHNPQDHFEIGYHLNEEGFLEIFWKDAFPVSFIDSYTVHSGLTQNTVVTIFDETQKSFVDYGYVCGNVHYEVRTFLKDGNSFLQQLSFVTPTPTFSFENLGPDKLRVCWDKPYANGRFNLIVDNITIASGINDTSITIPQIFGKNRQFSLEIRPQKAEYDNLYNKFIVWEWSYLGSYLGLPNFELYAYNITDNILYTRKYNSLVAFDATTLQEINTIPIIGNPWGFAYGGKIASAPHNSTVAAMTGEETWIFTDSRFINPVIISPLKGDIHTRLSALTSDDRFFVVQSGSNICNIYNTLTGEKISEFTFTYKTIYDIPDFVTVSEDGQFFCASSENGIEVFEINGTVTNILYTDARHYKGAMFVPSQSDKLLLRVGSTIEIRQIPDFDLLQTLDVSTNGALLCNIDPASMSLLYYQNDSLKVCKITNLSETIFKIRSDVKNCKMFNNKLLTHDQGGLYFDINPYLSN